MFKYGLLGGGHGHLGYFDQGVVFNRKVFYLEGRLWTISDKIFTSKPVHVPSRFHFASSGLQKIKTGYIYEAIQVKVTIIDSNGSGEFVKRKCFVSPEYNRVYESKKLMYKQNIKKTSV